MLRRTKNPIKGRTSISCKGTDPQTSSACGAIVCFTDGENFFLPDSDIAFEIDPPRVTCSSCGYKHRLIYPKKNGARPRGLHRTQKR